MKNLNYFKKDSVQRRIYIVLLICWIIIFTNENLRIRFTSTTDNLPLVFIIPVALCVLQVLFNNIVLWYLIVAGIISYSLWSFLSLIMFISVDAQKEYTSSSWTGAALLEMGLILLGFVFINGIVLLIKPDKKS